jgi:hypothetical protein
MEELGSGCRLLDVISGENSRKGFPAHLRVRRRRTVSPASQPRKDRRTLFPAPGLVASVVVGIDQVRHRWRDLGLLTLQQLLVGTFRGFRFRTGG